MSTCVTCKYYNPPEAANSMGICRRNPPAAFPIPLQGKPTPGNPTGQTLAWMSQYAPVHETMWCGMYMVRSTVAVSA